MLRTRSVSLATSATSSCLGGLRDLAEAQIAGMSSNTGACAGYLSTLAACLDFVTTWKLLS